ncbi:MAG: oligosaccharide flippase family protein [Abditibacteriota bacterium]|nr:oligosaccharide flippase family protein [Abditibacteriota bacterium]
MAESSRTKNSIRNVTVNILCQVFSLILSFATRTLFIKLLGADYLGISGLFSNILMVLSLASMGIESAIIYNLYKYLASDDKEKIAANINYYGSIYRIIGISVFVLGMALVPFLQYIVNLDNDIPHIKIYYIMYLLNSACSYFFVYKGSLFYADQKDFIIKFNRTAFLILTNIFQIIVLYFTHKFFIYLCVQLLCTLASNIFIYIYAEIKYPYLKASKASLDKKEKKDLFENIKSLFIYKLGSVIMNNTTNIIISVLVSTTVVGYYSNYYLIFASISYFAELIFSGITASVGNYVATKTKKEALDCFYMINFGNFWIYGFCSICIFCLIDDFITLWIGSEYLLTKLITFVISANVFIQGMISGVSGFRTATGIFRETKYVYLITAMLNLIFSVLLGKIWGMVGILISPGIARLCTNAWFEPYVLIKKKLEFSIRPFIVRMIKYYLITFVFIGVVYLFKKYYSFNLTWVSFIIELFVCVLFVNLVFFVLFRKTDNFNELWGKLKPFLLRKKK